MGEPRLVGRADVIRHYATLAPVLLPYLHDRPVNLRRFPDGIDARGFWHKARPDHAPDFVDSWRNVDADPGETETYSVLANPAAIAWAANFDAMELHPWTSTGDRPHRPTWALVDIDPGTSTGFDDVVLLARLHQTALDHLGVEACAKVTGSRGIQIWIPVEARYTFDDTRNWVERLSRLVGRQQRLPDL
jgi:bifunctional non-homologous end joining protein LigD